MSQQSPPADQPVQALPKIEFPCRYHIKVMGIAGEDFHVATRAILERHAGDIAETDITIRDSGGGNYQALTVTITATGIEQLQAIFDDLKAHERVKMVL